MNDPSLGIDASAKLLQLEREARHSPDEQTLRFVIVNRTHALLPYRRAVLARRTPEGKLQVVAVSGLPELERNAPFVRWAEQAFAAFGAAGADGRPRPVDALALKPELAKEWGEWSAPRALWCPLRDREERELGALWLSRDEPWGEAELVLAEHLCDAYAHAWRALTLGRARRGLPLPGRRAALAAAGLAALLLLVPLRQSALAPAVVVPSDPVMVAAPIDGVIAAFDVKPNQFVRKGQPLFHFEDTALRAKYEVARKSLAVAEAQYAEASQDAFHDPRSSAQTGVLRARVALRTAERDYAAAQLRRSTVTALRSGVALYSDPDRWVGKSVMVGERILELADPGKTQLRVELPVANAIALRRGAQVTLFLNMAPLHPLHAAVVRASYEARPTVDGILAYRVEARFAPGTRAPRIGLQGTARLYGQRVSLAYYLLRRPISSLRRWLGL